MTKLEQEIRELLKQRAPSEGERAAWARSALGMVPPRRRLPAWPLVAAILLVAFAVIPREGGTEPAGEPVATAPGDIAKQREANLKFLKKDEIQVLVREAEKGDWAVVLNGQEIQFSETLKGALERAEKEAPDARHRFVFQVDPERGPVNDVICDRAPVGERVAGLMFLDESGIKLEGGKFHYRGKRLDAKGKQAALSLRLGNAEIEFQVNKRSIGPLILPEGMSFPRFEIPGVMILEDEQRNWHQYRRYLVRVRQPDLGFDGYVEAAGGRYDGAIAPGNWIAVRLGGYVFRGVRKNPGEVAGEDGRRVLVLHLADGDTEALNRIFDKIEIGNFTMLCVPKAERSALRVYEVSGAISQIVQLEALLHGKGATAEKREKSRAGATKALRLLLRSKD